MTKSHGDSRKSCCHRRLPCYACVSSCPCWRVVLRVRGASRAGSCSSPTPINGSIPKSPVNTRPAAPYMFKCQKVICGTQVTCAHRSPGGQMSRVICAHRSPVGKMSRVTCAHRSPFGKMARVTCAHRSPVGKMSRVISAHRSPVGKMSQVTCAAQITMICD